MGARLDSETCQNICVLAEAPRAFEGRKIKIVAGFLPRVGRGSRVACGGSFQRGIVGMFSLLPALCFSGLKLGLGGKKGG